MNTKELMQNDFDKAFNGASVERVYISASGSMLVVGKRENSPTGKKYVVTHSMLNDSKYSFFWSTYDIETLSEACTIAQSKI